MTGNGRKRTIKRCCGCGELRPYSDFHKHARSSDGHQPRCKGCRSRAAKVRAAGVRTVRDCLICGASGLPHRFNRYCSPDCRREAGVRRQNAIRRARRIERGDYEIACQMCGATVPRQAPNHVVCGDCRSQRQRARVNAHAASPARRELARERAKRWAKANPERAAACSARQTVRRRARQRLVPVEDTAEYRRILGGDPCSYCGGTMQHVDHIDALSRGGGDVEDNLTASCRSCNSAKWAKPLLVYLLDRTAA
jgi:5-methylcytosine-specific restriction endonuclease McrA